MRNQDIFNENETTILNTLLRYENKRYSSHSKDGWLRNYEIMKKGKDLETNSDKYYKTLTEKGIIERSKLQIFDDKNRESFPYFYRIKRDKITFKTLCIAFLSKKEYSFLNSDYFDDCYKYSKKFSEDFYKSIIPNPKELDHMTTLICDIDDSIIFYSDYFLEFLKNPEEVKNKFKQINEALNNSYNDCYKKIIREINIRELSEKERETLIFNKIQLIHKFLLLSSFLNASSDKIKADILFNLQSSFIGNCMDSWQLDKELDIIEPIFKKFSKYEKNHNHPQEKDKKK